MFLTSFILHLHKHSCSSSLFQVRTTEDLVYCSYSFKSSSWIEPLNSKQYSTIFLPFEDFQLVTLFCNERKQNTWTCLAVKINSHWNSEENGYDHIYEWSVFNIHKLCFSKFVFCKMFGWLSYPIYNISFFYSLWSSSL